MKLKLISISKVCNDKYLLHLHEKVYLVPPKNKPVANISKNAENPYNIALPTLTQTFVPWANNKYKTNFVIITKKVREGVNKALQQKEKELKEKEFASTTTTVTPKTAVTSAYPATTATSSDMTNKISANPNITASNGCAGICFLSEAASRDIYTIQKKEISICEVCDDLYLCEEENASDDNIFERIAKDPENPYNIALDYLTRKFVFWVKIEFEIEDEIEFKMRTNEEREYLEIEQIQDWEEKNKKLTIFNASRRAKVLAEVRQAMEEIKRDKSKASSTNTATALVQTDITAGTTVTPAYTATTSTISTNHNSSAMAALGISSATPKM